MDTGSYSGQDRWRRIEELFYTALELPAETRSGFLNESCDGDFELRREVESLLEFSGRPLEVLEKSVQHAAQGLIANERPASVANGSRLAQYEVIQLLGTGGMGEVYLAQDVRLRRKVALKMLRRELVTNERGLQRFEREAQTVSALNHPNIVTVYEFGQANGLHFIATEYVEGRTVREELRSGRLKINRAIDIAIQIAGALQAAHASGIVHRDIKPDNVIVRTDGLVKVLDFGIAKLTDRPTGEVDGAQMQTISHTRPGMVIGTAKYMSPEQARGVPVDGRSDIFSLGAVLYEMAGGKAPFDGETESDVLAEILKGDPPPLAEFAPEVPGEMERMIAKAMRKDRGSRYQSIQELLADLKNFKSEIDFQAKLQESPRSPFSPSAEARVSGMRWTKWSVAATVMVLALCAGLYFGLIRPKTNGTPANPRTLAVLPFRNVKQDPQTDFLGFSLADAVITKLGYLDALTVRPSSSIEKYRNQAIDVRRVARELKVGTLLTGSFLKDGNDLHITAQLIDAKNDSMLWQDTINVDYGKLLTVQDRVAEQIIKGLELKLSAAEVQRMHPDRPIDTAAYEYYLRGVDLYSLGDYATSIKMLEKSVSMAPNYGPTWAQLGRAYATNASLQFGGSEQYSEAQSAFEKALALDPGLAEPRVLMANLLTDTGRVEQSVPLLRDAIRSSPNNAEAHWELGYAYRFGGMLDQSIQEAERARKLDPEVKINSSAMNAYLYVGEYDKFLHSLPTNDSVYIMFYRGFAQYYKNDTQEAVKAFDRAYELAPRLLQAEVGKALSYAIKHQNQAGLKLLHETENKIEERGVSDAEGVYKVAEAYAVLGDKASALRLLRRSIEGGFFCYSYQANDPLLRSLHGDPAFEALMKEAQQRHDQFKLRFFGERAGVDSIGSVSSTPALLF